MTELTLSSLRTFFLIHREPWDSTTLEQEILGDFQVIRNPFIIKYDLFDEKGNLFAILFGIPFFDDIETHDSIGKKEIRFDVNVNDIAVLEQKILPRLSGSFVLITRDPLPTRLYPDHSGSMPIVYDPELGSAASTASILLDSKAYETRFDADLYHKLVDSRRGYPESSIPGTLTAHKGVRRLLPNHSLDLSTWRAERFWPRPGDLDFERSPEDIVTDIALHLGNFVSRAASLHRVSIALTAGYDSRLILAAARDVRDRLSSFTMTGHPVIRDAKIAAAMAEKFGFQHRILEIVNASTAEQENWDLAVGHCVHETNRAIHPTLMKVDDADFILCGGFGEVGRCIFYKYNTLAVNDNATTPTKIIAQMYKLNTPEVQTDVALWLESLPDLPTSVVLDLAFLELCTAGGAQYPAQSAIKFALYPFGQRPVFKGFLEARPRDKMKGTLFQHIGRKLWAEVMDVPINRYGDYRDHLVTLSKLTDRRRVAAHLRKRFVHLFGT